MNIRRCLMLAWILAGLQVLSAGQNPAPQNPPVQSSGGDGATARTAPVAALSAIAGMQAEGSAQEDSSDLPQMPALLGGKGISSLRGRPRSLRSPQS